MVNMLTILVKYHNVVPPKALPTQTKRFHPSDLHNQPRTRITRHRPASRLVRAPVWRRRDVRSRRRRRGRCRRGPGRPRYGSVGRRGAVQVVVRRLLDVPAVPAGVPAGPGMCTLLTNLPRSPTLLVLSNAIFFPCLRFLEEGRLGLLLSIVDFSLARQGIPEAEVFL